MKKLIFEDTTVIKKPFVEIDGVEYEVQDGEFEGGTDLNAQNFNQVQDNIEDYIDGKTSMGSITVEDIECKNLLDVYFLSSGYINADGLNVEDTANGRGNNYIEVKPNTSYILSANTTIFGLRLNEYDENKNNIIQTSKTNTNQLTITTSSTTKYLRWSLNYDKSTLITANLLKSIELQLEKGTVKSDYVEHKKMSFTINDLIKQMVNIPGDFLKSTVNVDDLYNIQGIKAYPIWEHYPASMPNGAYQFGTLIVITQSTTNMFLNTQIYITDFVYNSPTDDKRGVYVRTGKQDWLRISGTTVSKKTASTTSTTNNENLELTDM